MQRMITMNTPTNMMPVERIHISKSFVPYLSLLFWPSKCFVYIYVYEIERTCAWGEKKEATNYTYSKWWCVYVVDKRKERKKKTCIVASFVLLIHAKNVKYQETHSLSFYSLYIYSVVTSKCRRRWRRDIEEEEEKEDYNKKNWERE